MQPVEHPPTTQASHHSNLHASKHVESHSIGDSVVCGALLTAAGFAVLGFLIGLDRAPGSFYTYGLSCFVWPMLSMMVLGALVGGSLGFVFGSIAHASDPVSEEVEEAVESTKTPAFGLRLHSHRH